MKITFTQYFNNPMGIRSAVITNRGMYQKLYRDKLDKILLREGGKVTYKLYKNKDKYYIHFKIPSEVVDKFYYDTIIEFYTDDSTISKSSNLRDYYVKFYSNDPAFVYTFAHAFIVNSIFIEDLRSKMTREARKNVAKEKNPTNMVGYVKSLFFAYLLASDYGLFSKTLYDKYAESYNRNKLLKEIEDAKDKVRKRQEEEEKLKKKQRREKVKERSASGNTTSPTSFSNKIKSTRLVSKIGSSKSVRKAKRI